MVSKCPTCGNPFEPVKLVVEPATHQMRLVEFDRCDHCLQRLDKINIEDFIVRWKWLYDAVESMVNSGRLFPVEGDNLLFSVMLGEDNDNSGSGTNTTS